MRFGPAGRRWRCGTHCRSRYPRPDRRQHRRGGDGNRGAARDRRRGEPGGAVRAGRGAGRGADRRGDAALVHEAVVVGAGGAVDAEGEGGDGAGIPACVGAGDARAEPRAAVRRARAGARADRGGVGARAGGGAVRAVDGRGRGRRGQVAAGGGGAGCGRASRRPGPLPALRGGDHLLAGGRGGQAVGGAAVGSTRGGGDALAARRIRRRDEWRRDRLGVPEVAGGAGAAGRGLRRPPVGRGDVSRAGRVHGAALGRRATSVAVHG